MPPDEVWRWYCRIDGAAGQADTRKARDEAAVAHSDTECRARDKPHQGWAEVGHLIHVWRW